MDFAAVVTVKYFLCFIIRNKMSIPVIIMVVTLGTNMIVYLIVTSLTLIFIDKTCHVTCSAISTRYWLRRV